MDNFTPLKFTRLARISRCKENLNQRLFYQRWGNIKMISFRWNLRDFEMEKESKLLETLNERSEKESRVWEKVERSGSQNPLGYFS